MESGEAEATLLQANRILADEQARSSNITSDPGGSQDGIKMSQLASLRKRHHFLNEYDDELILSTPITTLLKLESTSIKLRNLERNNDVDDKLAHNRDNLANTNIKVEAGQDNR